MTQPAPTAASITQAANQTLSRIGFLNAPQSLHEFVAEMRKQGYTPTATVATAFGASAQAFGVGGQASFQIGQQGIAAEVGAVAWGLNGNFKLQLGRDGLSPTGNVGNYGDSALNSAEDAAQPRP